MSDKEKTKWIIGLIVTICLAISGWLFGSLQAANAQSSEYIINRVDESDSKTNEFVLQFKTDIAEIKTDLKYIKEYFKSIGAN